MGSGNAILGHAFVGGEDQKMSTIIGIDPGQSGGIAAVMGNGKVKAWKMPATERDLWEQIFCRLSWCHDPHIFLEKVGPQPTFGQDGKRQGISSTWKFAQHNGVLRGMIIASGIPSETASPQKWCAFFGLKKGKDETQTAWKNRHKAKAQELFPGISVTHAIADALLIMEYGRRIRNGA